MSTLRLTETFPDLPQGAQPVVQQPHPDYRSPQGVFMVVDPDRINRSMIMQRPERLAQAGDILFVHSMDGDDQYTSSLLEVGADYIRLVPGSTFYSRGGYGEPEVDYLGFIAPDDKTRLLAGETLGFSAFSDAFPTVQALARKAEAVPVLHA